MDHVADPALAAFVAAARATPATPARTVGAGPVRRGQRARAAVRPPGPALAEVSDEPVAGVPVRIYRPAQSRATIVYAHGGMWVIGDLESHDRACRLLAEATGATVIAVDYRRAPEHPWPAAVDDVVAVLQHAIAAGGTVCVMGDSAGGNLATLACLRLRDAGEPLPYAQILLYPNTDLTLSRPSTRTKATGWALDTDDVAWGAELWVPDPAMRTDPRVSPLYADLHGLPRAVVVTVEHDPLRDEGDEYADRLRAAGVPAVHRCEAGLVHGFLTMDLVSPACAKAAERVFADITALLADA
ncbi:alpha/beta hydrolase [Hamadaea tsunoensis]|uniref:alpha/beta hydrolase n=1 Tax=Hamadaea tsunoensis TaxID=53368 RepID=UPI001B7FEA23|nr:alpha/beta hydrolase [Hamadaea tsunoensis]